MKKKYYMNCLRVSNIFTNVFKAILKFVSIFKFGWLFGNTQISSNIIASCVWRMSIPLHRFLFIIQSCDKFRTHIYAHHQKKVKILMIYMIREDIKLIFREPKGRDQKKNFLIPIRFVCLSPCTCC